MQRGAGICRVNRGHRERLQGLFIAFSVEFGPGWKAEHRSGFTSWQPMEVEIQLSDV